MIACEPSDQILAALLDTNDHLLSAVTGWDATAQRLAMLQSQQQPGQSAPLHVSQSAAADAAEQLFGSGDNPPAATPSSGGAFWGTVQPQTRQSHANQPQRAKHQPQHQQSPAVGSSSARRQAQQSSRQGTGNSYLDDLDSQTQYPHQQIQPRVDTWQPFGADSKQPSSNGPDQAPGLASSSRVQPAQASHSYQGTVLNYTLKDQQPLDANGVNDLFTGVCSFRNAVLCYALLCCLITRCCAVLTSHTVLRYMVHTMCMSCRIRFCTGTTHSLR